VHWCAPDGFEPFWAITKHADVCEISKQPDAFSSARGIAVLRRDEEARVREQSQGFGAMRVIIEMDPPEHRSYRSVARPVFTPRAVKAMDDAIRTSAREIVDRLAGEAGEGECDFAADRETLGYYLITFSAGHDTTKNPLVGGMRALLEHPDPFEKLKRRPELLDSAVEEVVRWTSPVNHMKRMEWAEFAGEPEQVPSAFVVGLEKLPMRYRIQRAARRSG